MQKYVLTTNTCTSLGGTTLYQIKALRDFDDVKAGDLGGWIEQMWNLSHTGNCWVYNDAHVFNTATVYMDAKISGNAKVYGNAFIEMNARVFGNSRVYGNETRISGNAKVFGVARVHNGTHMSGNDMASNKYNNRN